MCTLATTTNLVECDGIYVGSMEIELMLEVVSKRTMRKHLGRKKASRIEREMDG